MSTSSCPLSQIASRHLITTPLCPTSIGADAPVGPAWRLRLLTAWLPFVAPSVPDLSDSLVCEMVVISDIVALCRRSGECSGKSCSSLEAAGDRVNKFGHVGLSCSIWLVSLWLSKRAPTPRSNRRRTAYWASLLYIPFHHWLDARADCIVQQSLSTA